KWLHARVGFSEAPPAAIRAPRPQASAERPQVGAMQAPRPTTLPCFRPATAARQVELIPGRHLVTNASGTVIVVANRGAAPLSPQSVAARQLSALVEIVRRTDRQRVANAVWQLTMGKGAAVDFAVIMPTAAGLDIFLRGAVTVALD